MVNNIEILNNKVDFLIFLTKEIHKGMDLNFDFNTFVLNNNLTSTDIVLIVKALTIMNYRRFDILSKHISEFENDRRFESILIENKPTFNEFDTFLKTMNMEINGENLLKNLKKQKIGENICTFLLEDKVNN